MSWSNFVFFRYASASIDWPYVVHTDECLPGWAVYILLRKHVRGRLFQTMGQKDIRMCGIVHFRQFGKFKNMTLNVKKVPLDSLRNLIRIFTLRILDSQGCKASSWGRRRLVRRLWFAIWLESLLGAHVRMYVFRRRGLHSRTPMARTPMARLPWLTRTSFWVLTKFFW